MKKSKYQIAAEKVIQYIIDYESEPIKNSRRLFYVGSHENPEPSVRAIANATGIIRKVFEDDTE